MRGLTSGSDYLLLYPCFLQIGILGLGKLHTKVGESLQKLGFIEDVKVNATWAVDDTQHNQDNDSAFDLHIIKRALIKDTVETYSA